MEEKNSHIFLCLSSGAFDCEVCIYIERKKEKCLEVFEELSRCAYMSRGTKKRTPLNFSHHDYSSHIKNPSTHIFIIKSHCQHREREKEEVTMVWNEMFVYLTI